MTQFTFPSLRRLTIAGSLAAAMAFTAQPALADEQEGDEVEMTKGEAKLAKMLEGRVAGEPQSCINGTRLNNVSVIDGTAYVYGRGRTIYVQRTRNPESIDDRDIVVDVRNTTQICKVDSVTTVDRFLGFFTGVHFFEDFIPYTRVEDSDG